MPEAAGGRWGVANGPTEVGSFTGVPYDEAPTVILPALSAPITTTMRRFTVDDEGWPRRPPRGPVRASTVTLRARPRGRRSAWWWGAWLLICVAVGALAAAAAIAWR